MARLLLIEISAFHTFAWAEAMLADDRPRRGRRRGREARVVRAGRRDAACRVPEDGAVRDARPHVRGRLRQEARRQRPDRSGLGASARRITRQRAASSASSRPWASSSTCSRRTRGAPTSSIAFTSSDPKTSQGERPVNEVRHLLRAPAARGRGTTTPSCELIQDALDQVELADKLGIQYVWEVEHHFLEEYSHSSAPEVFLAAAASARRTSASATASSRPRRATTTRPAPPSASRRSTWCRTAASSSARASRRREAELGGFGIDPMHQARDVARGARGRDPLHDRDAVHAASTASTSQMPPRNVVPKPVQKPHPPLWVACSRRDTILLAAEKGIGALTLRVHRPRRSRRTGCDDYERRSPRTCVPVGQAVNPQVACVTPMMVHHDEHEAIARGIEGANFFGYSLAHYYVFGEHTPGATDVWHEFNERRDQMGYSPEVAVALEAGAARRQDRRRRHDGSARRGRHARPAARVPAPLRGGRRRPDHLRACRPARTGTSTSWSRSSSSGREVLPEFTERDDEAGRRQDEAPRAGRREGARPQGARRRDLDGYTFPALRGSGPTTRARKR